MQTLATLVSLVSPSLLSASSYTGAVCKLNGQVVACPNFMNFFSFLFPVFFFGVWALIAVVVVSAWKIFTKAGKPGWAALIPIYNVVKMLEIVGKPDWWVLLMFVPFVNCIISIIIAYHLALVFGKDTLFTLGLIFLPFIFYPILAFGDAKYQGPTSQIGAQF